jgi:hypothetical protein
MTDLILVRLHPGQQVDPADFTDALDGLQITAYDLMVDTPGRVKIGTATVVTTVVSDPVDLSKAQIYQHWKPYQKNNPDDSTQMESAATAIIQVIEPAGHKEYPTADSYDVQLEITRHDIPIADVIIEYNAAVWKVQGAPSTDQLDYFTAPPDAATYVMIPPAVKGDKPALILSSDGTPPPFHDLKNAIDAVLEDDPGGTGLVEYTLSYAQDNDGQPIPAAQCYQIAAEIIYNRAYLPPPAEPADYGLLYTSNPASELNVKAQDEDSTRQQFEGKVTAYHATNDALAAQLAGYVYTASAAVLCEQRSGQATTAGFPFPLIVQDKPVIDTEVELTGLAAGSFAVSAGHFYALAVTVSSQVSTDFGQRYQVAIFAPEDTNLKQLNDAVAAGVIKSDQGFVTPSLSPSDTLKPNQAARRLSSLGTVSGSLPAVAADASVSKLVDDWLGWADDTAKVDTDFWQAEVGAAASHEHQGHYLDLVLQVVIGETSDQQAFGSFKTAIQAAPLAIATVSDLAKATDQAWQSFFTAHPDQLPSFTAPGTAVERAAAFVRHLRKFFATPAAPVKADPQSAAGPGTLGWPPNDILSLFIANYAGEGGGTFTFGAAWDDTALANAVKDTLPGDTAAQAWLNQALQTIQALCQVTAFADAAGSDIGELRFSLMEALYARGFTTTGGMVALTSDAFQTALEGSVAYPYAAQIQKAAGEAAKAAAAQDAGFLPVNPDGSVTNCVPPPHVSPLGPAAYLAHLLRVTTSASCDNLWASLLGQPLLELLKERRGPLGDLHATAANLDTPVPALDLVNESLEALTAAVAGGKGAAGGAVFDTSDVGHDAADVRAAIPEYSSPAAENCPAAESAAYAWLRADFTAPGLPYDQPLDICRLYLCQLDTSRYQAMRRFRKDITEFVLDPLPDDEPLGFQRHRWRYPVAFDAALEYLGISTQEYDLLYAQPIATNPRTNPGKGQQALWGMYGFPAAYGNNRENWTDTVAGVPEFLRRTGLSYCDLVDLQRSRYMPITAVAAGRDAVAPANGTLPDCEPCCLDDLRLVFTGPDRAAQRSTEPALYQLIVFIRLWRRLRERAWCDLTATELATVVTALGLFGGTPANPVPDPDFLRQLAALLMLRDDLSARPLDLLPLWLPTSPPADWDEAVGQLLRGIERHARSRWSCRAREPKFHKVIAGQLDPLSRLAGFDPDTPGDSWHARPTHTLRFAEVLGKIHASDFTVGEILFLFTAADHLDGDDPFPIPDVNESVDDPLALPEAPPEIRPGTSDRPDSHGAPHSLWALRGALLRAEADHDEAQEWSWRQIAAELRDEFGYPADSLTDLAEHFFPHVLEREDQTVSPQARQYRTLPQAAGPTKQPWNTGPGPFRYDATGQQLWTRLPLRDAEVIAQLQELPQLQAAEVAAVRELYFAPRATLTPFGMIFSDFQQAVEILLDEPDAEERFGYFQRQFARFHRRCRLIAHHLDAHVAAALGRPGAGDERDPDDHQRHTDSAAWRVLRELLADGNLATSPWERDTGDRPPVTWAEPAGSAFAALLGLCGTGLLGEFTTTAAAATTAAASTTGVGDEHPVWREIRGPLRAFGHVLDEHNCPVPTVLPALGLSPTARQLRQVAVRNGFALRDADDEPLGGAQPFTARWTGELLVETGGEYRFYAGAPAEDEPDGEAAERDRWRVTLQRGDRTWTLLSHGHGVDVAPAGRSAPLALRTGAYQITAEFEQRRPLHERPEDICAERTGFEVAYRGPDTGGEVVPLPRHRLFRPFAAATLGDGLGLSGAQSRFLDGQYSPSLRDIRRTYQRAFKALLFARRFALSARRVPGYRQSELGYLLDDPQAFQGVSYYRTGQSAFGTHYAWFDPNLLPVADPYPPLPAPLQPLTDQRADPKPYRQAALFDWWERVFDYCWLRDQVGTVRQRPPWLLFAHAAGSAPGDSAELLGLLGVDQRHGQLLCKYFDTPNEYPLTAADLADERWPVRAWHAETWLRRIAVHFTPHDMTVARPDLWASDDPAAADGTSTTGNANLTGFVRDGFLGGSGPRRYRELTAVNDRLREHARDALTAYLCAMDRVAFPAGQPVQRPADLSALLLQDVETGPGTRMSRIEDAIRAVQALVQRARLGLEPGFAVTPAFARVWDTQFSSFRIWQACARRAAYMENWIEWDDLRAARRSEAFGLLEQQLRRATLTVPAPGGGVWWPGTRPPAAPSLELLQNREPTAAAFVAAPADGLGLLGTVQRAAEQSLLAPVLAPAAAGAEGANDNARRGGDNADGGGDNQLTSGRTQGGTVQLPGTQGAALPLWLRAAVRLGAHFVRVAAAGIPPAAALLTPYETPVGCCAECGGEHPPVVDEYYFWLADSRYFLDTDASQDADAGGQDASLPADASSAWEDSAQLPGLLMWPPRPMVHLYWTRVRHGAFEPPRRSAEGIPVKAPLPLGESPLGQPAQPQLVLAGRTGDSLRFTVANPDIPQPPAATADTNPPGFRYDLAADAAVPLPEIIQTAPQSPPPAVLAELVAYPYFAYVRPGAPVEPLAPHSIVTAVAGTLRTHCEFEAALKWYELAFTPLTSDNTWATCRAGRDGGRGTMVTQGGARDRAILLGYLETLLQWGDALRCRNSPEAAEQAKVIFETLSSVLGQCPVTVHGQDDGGDPMPMSDFTAWPAPLNPRLLALYERCADRLALVRQRLDGQRLRTQRLRHDPPFWGDETLHDGWRETGAGQSCCTDGLCHPDECLCCTSPYRFTFLLPKALELAGEVRGLGAALLAAYEKGDAEALAALRAAHDRQIAELTLATRQNAWREADWQVQALGMTKQSTQARYRYYQQLLAAQLNKGETAYQALTGVSIQGHGSANTTEAVGQAMEYIPDFAFGVAGLGPYASTQVPVGSKLAGTFATLARIINTEAEMAGINAALNLTQATWDRRTQDWQLQVETLGIDLDQIQRQILAAQRHRDGALRELNIAQQQIAHAAEVQDFLRDKFSRDELYRYLHQETAALYRQMYELALHAAQQAQRAFNRERGHTARQFLPEPGWENLHGALLAGERLQLAVRQLETAYLDLNCREYELTKHLSLRLDFPLAYLHLRLTGWAEIEVPEWMFDADYPGQYMRRVRNVTMTVPCVAGPYTGVHCRLTLLSSATRVDPRLAGPIARCCDDRESRDCGCGCGGGGDDCGRECGRCGCDRREPIAGYVAEPGDSRVVREHSATQAIATSSGQNDAGLHELSFADPRYLPFEFAGAVSRWRIELPPENNRFPLETVSDLVIHLNYTAREGGDVLRRAASEQARQSLPGGGQRFLDARHDLPDAWARLRQPRQRGLLPLHLGREHFPFLPGHCDVRITRLGLYFEMEDPGCVAHHEVRLVTQHEHEHQMDDDCRCAGRDIDCVASRERPGVYYGSADCDLPPLRHGRTANLGDLCVPLPGARIRQLFLVLGYQAAR